METCATCGCRAHVTPETVREVTGTALGRLMVMAGLAQRGMAAAEAAATAGRRLDARSAHDVRAGYAAAVDLLHALAQIHDTGRMPDPARRWMLGVPDHGLPLPGRRTRG